MKNITGIHFNKSHGKFSSNVNTAGKRIFLGYFDTEDEAIQAKLTYQQQFLNGKIDYSKLARDKKAWNTKANEIIHQLSKRADACKGAN